MKKLIYYIVAVVLLLGLSSTMPTSSSPHKHLSIEEYILGLYVQDTFTKLGLSYSQKNLAKPIQLYGEEIIYGLSFPDQVHLFPSEWQRIKTMRGKNYVSWIKSSVAQMKWHPFVKVLDSVNLKDFWADYETKIFKNEVKPFELPRGVGKMKWEDMLANDSIPIWYFIPCRVLESRDYYLMAIITVKKNIYREKLSSSMNEVMLRKADQKLIRGKTEWGGNFNFSEFRKEYGAE